MTNLTRVKLDVAIVFPDSNMIRDGIAAVAIEAGQPVCFDTNGNLALSDANDANAEKFRGIALRSVGAGQPCSYLIQGWLSGTGQGVTALAYDAPVYISDTVGELADSAGSTSLLIGRVVPLSDKDRSKVLFINGFVG